MSMSSPFIKLIITLSSAALLYACATPSQVYWDNKVKELCEKDGGVTVYETVELTKEEKEKLQIRNTKYATKNDMYYSEIYSENISDGNPKIFKTKYLIFRSSDKKLIGKQVDYGRIGGDIPNGISHPSSYSCDKAGISTEIEKEIFIIKGE